MGLFAVQRDKAIIDVQLTGPTRKRVDAVFVREAVNLSGLRFCHAANGCFVRQAVNNPTRGEWLH